jgi:hypothetical protein
VASYVKPNASSSRTILNTMRSGYEQRLLKTQRILGLGDLVLLQKERIQPNGVRLDLLFQDDTKRRSEVELQLGQVDESHRGTSDKERK